MTADCIRFANPAEAIGDPKLLRGCLESVTLSIETKKEVLHRFLVDVG